ncbi:MAG: transglycosylase SLT domain-containing protein [Campylobacterota bacterium]|nr:transglycosylase SLT domain-containing protein [Campylobacterota bacterium]
MIAIQLLKNLKLGFLIAIITPLLSCANNTFTIDLPKNQFIHYQKNYLIQSKHFKKALKKDWDTQEVSTNKKWVGYSADLQQKQVIDFETNSIFLETINKSEKEARQELPKMLHDLLDKTITDVVVGDIIESNLPITQTQTRKNKKVTLLPLISLEQKQKLQAQLLSTPLSIVQYKDHTIYKAKIKLPKKYIIKKAKRYRKDVDKYSQKYKIDPSLIYAIMHSESDFNPVARSFAPAYGLMQIVPKTAGIDAYKFIYKKRRAPSVQYLYNPSNNIKLGSAYLHILYYIYFKDIHDEKSRLYCTIAAYNSGAGNVARSFIKSSNLKRAIPVINALKPAVVYQKMLTDLPFLETRRYLKKVHDKLSMYDHLLKNELAI